MDALKWLLKASLVLAVLFLGLKTEPSKDNADNDNANRSSTISILSK
jgi:hypothetical protein